MKNKTVMRGRVFQRAGAAAVAVALLAAPGIAAADSRQVPKAAERPELQKVAQEFVDAGFAGMQLRVRDERGEWAGSAGVSRLGAAAKPPTNGRFRIGSSTKTFVSTLVLQLVAEGKVGLDDPVADYRPEFGLDRRITVRMLLQHTSGLYDHVGGVYDDGTPVPGIPWQGKEWVAKRFHTYQPEELVRMALAKGPRFEPGKGWNYANTNYVLASLVVEKVTGRPYGEEMRRRILGPLGLRGTSVPGTRASISGPHAHAYHRYQDADGQWKTIDVVRQNPSWVGAGGEMVSTTKDLRTFFSALNGGRLLPAPLLTEMRTPNPRSGAYRYGMGIFVQDLGPGCDTVYHHNGGLNGYGTLMYSTPDGRKTLTASITAGDSANDPAKEFPRLSDKLVRKVFCR